MTRIRVRRAAYHEFNLSDFRSAQPRAFFLVCGRRRSLEKIRRLDVQYLGEVVDNVDTGRIDASLESANIGPIDICAVRELLLRQALYLPELSQIERQYLSDVHAREGIVLQSISPRSIFDKGKLLTSALCSLSWRSGVGWQNTAKVRLSTRRSDGGRQGLNFGTIMHTPPLDPDIADLAPTESALTAYDELHVVTYMRLLQAESESADWRDVARIVLHVDPERDLDRARNAYESHLARAKWLTEQGRLLRSSESK